MTCTVSYDADRNHGDDGASFSMFDYLLNEFNAKSIVAHVHLVRQDQSQRARLIRALESLNPTDPVLIQLLNECKADDGYVKLELESA